jgi:hypothetical protein
VGQDGYPEIEPPWGLLNCYDLNTGKALWRLPLGELEELTKQGVPKTGSQTLGGASVTAGGLVFVSGTEDEKLRAFDADNGAEPWSSKLPFAGTSAPAIYEVNGREYVVTPPPAEAASAVRRVPAMHMSPSRCDHSNRHMTHRRPRGRRVAIRLHPCQRSLVGVAAISLYWLPTSAEMPLMFSAKP